MEEGGRKKTIDDMSDAIERTADKPFLRWLRCWGHTLEHCDLEGLDDLLIQNQFEFPQKIRDDIRNSVENDLFPGRVYLTSGQALLKLLLNQPRPGISWSGLDKEIDTEEELEVALRFFPSLLDKTGNGIVDGKNMRNQYIPFWLSTCLKSLPFASLVVELMFELATPNTFASINRELCFYDHSFLDYTPTPTHEEYERELNGTCLSALLRINKEFLRKGSEAIYNVCVIAFKLGPSRIGKTLRFLLDWDLSVLKGNCDGNRKIIRAVRIDALPIAWHSLQRSAIAGREVSLKRFRMLFELGMVKYPESMGFSFHVFNFKGLEGHSIFRHASDRFGKKPINKIVEEVLLKTVGENSPKIQTLMVAVAANNDISVDALFLLYRQHPTALMPSAVLLRS